MQLHNIQPEHPLKGKKRVGRGGKRGTTSGHGQKGQKSRAGRSIKPQIRETLLRMPKLRGIKFKSAKRDGVALSLDTIMNVAHDKEVVTLSWLIKKKLVEKKSGRIPSVKILQGKQKAIKPIHIKGIPVSKSVSELLTANGGGVE